jgi:hypothetical protein
LATAFFDLENKFVGGQSLEPQVCAASTALEGTAIDMLNADGPVFAYMTLGTCTDTGGTLDVDAKIQECATSTGTFTDFSVGGSFTQSYNQTTGDLVSEWLTTAHRQYRYVRAYVNITGTTVSVPIHVSCLSMKKTLGNSGTYTSNP